MNYSPGSLVKARGREWVVLPESQDDLLILRPLGGTDDEVTGIHTALEHIESASFELPDPTKVGDFRSCRLLRDAVRLSTRSAAGPFRSFARISVEPRPYQVVPLLIALKLDPIRMLIADDVGIGKTIEACLVSRELLDRGEIERLAVLCPPHLAEQWQMELSEKFHIDAEVVLASTAGRLERNCRLGQSLFELYPYVVVSMDFIKSDRRRDEFIRTCPELVIVDEAHTCAFGYEGKGGRHQRHQLLKRLAQNDERHIMLVTATPHSGKEETFRSLLSFLDPEFTKLPQDLSGKENERHRRRLAAHFIQRRRADIRNYMDSDTPFPSRLEKEETYSLSSEYKKLFERVLNYTREIVFDESGGKHRQRVRWWAALALLRSMGSSPAAAASSLRNRTATLETETAEAADEIGRRTVFDVANEDLTEGVDVAPGADMEQDDAEHKDRRRLLDMARAAEKLMGDKDAKLLKAVDIVKQLLKDGFHPILFCRFIPTAEYVAQELRERLRGVEVFSVTGTLPPADREARVAELAQHPKRVLVCTDCLSEGINLQEHFDAVMHYDLSWSPTRHEQREGRVDRFGQPKEEVRVLTYYGIDNAIDGIVLDVLIRKHKTIRSSLGISVAVPVDTDAVVEAIFEGFLLKEQAATGSAQMLLPGLDEYLKPKKKELDAEWENAAEREKRSRTMFAQETIKVDEVAQELGLARSVVGSAQVVEKFTLDALRASKAFVSRVNGHYQFDLAEVDRSLKDVIGTEEKFEGRFELPVQEGVKYLGRTHPLIDGLSAYVMDTTLDPVLNGVARRAGAIRTRLVDRRTTLLLVRFRFDILTRRGRYEYSQLAEECRLLAFAGAPDKAEWLGGGTAEGLLNAEPEANIEPEQASGFVSKVVEGFSSLKPHLDKEARARANALLESHLRVRAAVRLKKKEMDFEVKPQLPPDVLGIYVLLPVMPGGAA